MPTKKKSPAKRTTRVTSRTKSNRLNPLQKLISSKKALVIVLGIALVGVFVLFRANAATTNFEAESATLAGGATSVADTAASGGRYAKFSSSPISISNVSRFPGDPNPRVTGKAYWGSSVGGNGNPSRHESPTGKSLSVRRTFWGWNSNSMISTAREDIAANRLPFISIKTPGWAAVASGRHDAELDSMINQLDNLGGPVWFVVHHEPEGGCKDSCQGPKGEDDAAGAEGWRNMQKRVADRLQRMNNGQGPKNIAFMPVLMSWTWDSRSNRNPEDWWVPGIWDAYIVDHYKDTADSAVMSSEGWSKFSTWIESKGLPYGTAEWGLRTGGRKGVTGGSYEPVPAGMTEQEYCRNPILRQTTVDRENEAKMRMKEFWEWGFNNKKDVVVYTYFDTCINSGNNPWLLGSGQLEEFQNILKNDSRVARVKELGNATVSTYGTITANVSIPATGNYKVWVRMNAPDTTNNAIQVQVDNGVTTKIGDGGIPASAWTWVDWKNGDINNKTTLALSAGIRSIKLTGIEPNVKVDRILITDENCVPSGTGDNCTTIVTNPDPGTGTGNLNVNIVSPLSNQTVSGTVKVDVEPETNVEEVSFRINNVWQTTVKTAPFEWNWDTTRTPNGTAAVTIRARKVGDPGTVYTERNVNVTVKNNTTTVTPPPADTITPTRPTNLSAKIGTMFKQPNGAQLKWTASTDNVGVVKYEILRDGVKIGETTQTTYTDTTIELGKIYTYVIIAKDAANLSSLPVGITVQGTCDLVSCKTTVY